MNQLKRLNFKCFWGVDVTKMKKNLWIFINLSQIFRIEAMQPCSGAGGGNSTILWQGRFDPWLPQKVVPILLTSPHREGWWAESMPQTGFEVPTLPIVRNRSPHRSVTRTEKKVCRQFLIPLYFCGSLLFNTASGQSWINQSPVLRRHNSRKRCNPGLNWQEVSTI